MRSELPVPRFRHEVPDNVQVAPSAGNRHGAMKGIYMVLYNIITLVYIQCVVRETDISSDIHSRTSVLDCLHQITAIYNVCICTCVYNYS